MKTIRDWFRELPDPICSQAFNNVISQSKTTYEVTMRLNAKYETLGLALSHAFVFAITPQGDKYWQDIKNKSLQNTLQQDIQQLLNTFKPKQNEKNLLDDIPYSRYPG